MSLARLAACLVLAATARAPAINSQTSDASQTFSVSTELVSVPVAVTDSQGHHIHGLSAADFRIFENGHSQAIRSFEVISAEARSSPPSAGTLPIPHVESKQASALAAVILLFDQVNTPVNEQAEVRRLLAKYYRGRTELVTPTCVVLYTGAELRLVAQPTDNSGRIASAIDQLQSTITSNGAGISGELPLPAGARENSVVGDGKLREGACLDQRRHHRSVPTAELQAARIRVYPLTPTRISRTCSSRRSHSR